MPVIKLFSIPHLILDGYRTAFTPSTGIIPTGYPLKGLFAEHLSQKKSCYFRVSILPIDMEIPIRIGFFINDLIFCPPRSISQFIFPFKLVSKNTQSR